MGEICRKFLLHLILYLGQSVLELTLANLYSTFVISRDSYDF